MKRKRTKWIYTGWRGDAIGAERFLIGLGVGLCVLGWRTTFPVIGEVVLGVVGCLGVGIGGAWVVDRMRRGRRL